MASCGGTRSGWRRPEPGAARVRKYLGRRAAYAAGTLLGVSLIIFVVLRILPGDPLVAILGVEGHARMSAADRVRIRSEERRVGKECRCPWCSAPALYCYIV